MSFVSSFFDTDAAASGVAWAALTGITLGGMAVLDSFVTGVTDHGGGEYTFNLDYTQNRTFPANGDLYIWDPITAWKAAGGENRVLEVKITVVTRPDNVAGNPYVGIFHKKGASVVRTGSQMTGVLIFGTTDTTDVLVTGAIATSATNIGTVDSIIMRWTPSSTASRNQHAIDFYAVDGATVHSWGQSQDLAALPKTAEIDVGFDTASGCHFALAFQQNAADTGTGSMRLKFEYRLIERPLSAS